MTTRAARAMRATEATSIWEQRVAELERSGISCAEFAAREGLRAATLGWWRWALRRSAPPKEPQITFVEIEGTVATSPADRVEVVLCTGRVVRVPPGFDADTLRRVLDVAERR